MRGAGAEALENLIPKAIAETKMARRQMRHALGSNSELRRHLRPAGLDPATAADFSRVPV
ncbi:hypothetical protein AGR1B_Cc120380 [Agrobacterium fabacearum S56]|nr:hypothetical protein AGR1B_Cc120380 [Agrobacterium fabacearum S56]